MKVRAKLLPFVFKLDSKLQELSELIAHGHTITQSFDACALFTEVDKDWSVFDLNDKTVAQSNKSAALLKLIDNSESLLSKEDELKSREKSFGLFKWYF